MSYQVNECLKQRDHWRSEAANWKDQLNEALTELERLRGDGWDQAAREGDRKQLAILSAELEQERQTSGTLYKDWLKAQAEVERLRAATVDDPACSDPMCSYRAEALTRGAMPTLTPEEVQLLVWALGRINWIGRTALQPTAESAKSKLSLIANGGNE